jgi:hypothetical protein
VTQFGRVGLFGKKYPPKAEIRVAQEESTWTLYQADQNGKPLFVLICKEAKALLGHPEFRHQVGIAIPLRRTNEHGLPTNEEAEDLNRIEDMICAQLGKDNETLFLGRLTFPGVRELVLYTSNPRAVEAKMEEVSKSVASHQLQLMIQEDPKWEVLRRLLP